MKKISTLLAAAAISAATANVSAENVYCMPGSYPGNNWSLEKNIFENVDGKLIQHIDELTGEFKIVRYEAGSPSWDIAWGSNGEGIASGLPYQASFGGGNISLAGKSTIMKDVTVAITPGENDAMTIELTAGEVIEQGDIWYLVGDAPLNWDMPTTNTFTKGDGNVYTFNLTGELTQTFKVVKNGKWSNSYTTEGTIELGKEYPISAPKDPANNMSPANGPWTNPTFTIVDNGDAGIVLTVTTEAGVEAIEAEAAEGEAVYYNLYGQRVAEPENGLYIRVQGGKATKVAL